MAQPYELAKHLLGVSSLYVLKAWFLWWTCFTASVWSMILSVKIRVTRDGLKFHRRIQKHRPES
jgi:hypothetical protein